MTKTKKNTEKTIEKNIKDINHRISGLETHIVNLITKLDDTAGCFSSGFIPSWMKELKLYTTKPLTVNTEGIKQIFSEFNELMGKFQKGTWAVDPDKVYATLLQILENSKEPHYSHAQLFNLQEDIKRVKNYMKDMRVCISVKSDNIQKILTEDQDKFLYSEVDDTNTPIRLSNCLHRLNLKTWKEVLDFGRDALLRCRNVGKKSVEEVAKIFKQYDIEYL